MELTSTFFLSLINTYESKVFYNAIRIRVMLTCCGIALLTGPRGPWKDTKR